MLKNRKFTVNLIIFFIYTTSAGVNSQEHVHTKHEKNAFDVEREKIIDRIKQRWTDQIERSGDDRDTRELDLTGKNGEIVIHGGYATTSMKNPLVSDKCRAESLAKAVLNLQREKDLTQDQAFEKAEEHLRSQQEKFSKGITFSNWIKHIAACKAFCNVTIVNLLQCHIESVSKHPNEIVLFDFDSYSIKPEFDSNNISRFANDIVNNPSKSILLLARASQAGTAGKDYNRRLSQLRGSAVKKAFLSRKVPHDRIKVQHLGNEEPQLNEWMAELYGLQHVYQHVGATAMNQSVLMVLY